MAWPSECRFLLSDCIEEGKQELAKIKLTFQCKRSLPLFGIQRFSYWRRLSGVTAWISRFISRSRRARHQKRQETRNKPNESLEKGLEPEEINDAERYWVRETQTERFSEELTTFRGEEASREAVRCGGCHHLWTVMESYVSVGHYKCPIYPTMSKTLSYC